MSWAPEVTVESGGTWTGNALRFATKEEAERYARDLAMRWTSVRDWRCVEKDERVNYKIEDGRLVYIQADPFMVQQAKLAAILGEV